MLNIIRTTPNRVKYCGRTVDNLIQSNADDEHEVMIVASSKTPNENGIAAVKAGLKYSMGQPFVFLEDDLAFISKFNRAAETFATTCKGAKLPFIPLCAAYGDSLRAFRGIAWPYPLKDFYGTQAFVMYPDMAEKFLEWVGAQPSIPKKGFDLLIRKWAEQAGFMSLLTPHVSFIQHCGVESSLHNGRFHHYSTWPGDQFEYRTGAFSVEEQRNRQCDTKLATAIGEWFGPKCVAYDMGCSTGKYVRHLREMKVPCRGFDATPGLAGEFVDELDLARPQKFPERPGNVMSLEVAEHIHPVDEQHFIANIRTLCAFKMVLSWAVPGQGGRRHVNERDAEYVHGVMSAAGLQHNSEMTDRLREASEFKWFKKSIYAFEKK